MTVASGCGSMVRDYARLLADDEQYREKQPGSLRTLKTWLNSSARWTSTVRIGHPSKVGMLLSSALHTSAWSVPARCGGRYLAPGRRGTEVRLRLAFCCGSAGTYSLTQPKLSTSCETTLANLTANEPTEILSANIGCIHHLGGTSNSRAALGRTARRCPGVATVGLPAEATSWHMSGRHSIRRFSRPLQTICAGLGSCLINTIVFRPDDLPAPRIQHQIPDVELHG